ncbi:hypothetical protein Taro_011188, partial [Colocasia esculenta]|nr:hypothetical protein [Colocasia esculenta]
PSWNGRVTRSRGCSAEYWNGGRSRSRFLGFCRAKTAPEAQLLTGGHQKSPRRGGRWSSSSGGKKPEMGGKCPHRKVKKRRFSHKTSRRSKFLLKDILLRLPDRLSSAGSRDDAVYEELMKLANSEGGEAKPLPLDEDLPGMGQFYCLHCDRYFASAEVRDDHFKSKLHKKRYLSLVSVLPFSKCISRSTQKLAIFRWKNDRGNPPMLPLARKKSNPSLGWKSNSSNSNKRVNDVRIAGFNQNPKNTLGRVEV